MVSAITPFGWDLQTEDLFELQDLILVSVTEALAKGTATSYRCTLRSWTLSLSNVATH